MRAVFLKEIQELRRDKVTLGMLIVMPLLLLIVFGYAANFTIDSFTVGISGSSADQVEDMINDNDDLSDELTIDSTDDSRSESDAKNLLRDEVVDVAIYAADGKVTIYLDGSNLFIAQSAQVAFAQAAEQLAGNPQAPDIDVDILYNPDLKTSWVMIPAIIGLILTFIGTIITSIGLVREREAGTLEQLAVMPLSASSVILGKITPYFLVASFDMVLIAALGIWLFDVPFRGSLLIFIVGAALFLFAVLGIGVLISSVAKNTGQAIQFALMTLLPQILLSGMIFPLEAMAAGVRWIAYILPLSYFTMVSRGIMLKDATWDSLWFPIMMLAIMAVVIFGLAVARLHASLRPAKRHGSK